MDIDFIRYSLSDESINQFIKRLIILVGICIERTGSNQWTSFRLLAQV